jgi:hypothetical protein
MKEKMPDRSAPVERKSRYNPVSVEDVARAIGRLQTKDKVTMAILAEEIGGDVRGIDILQAMTDKSVSRDYFVHVATRIRSVRNMVDRFKRYKAVMETIAKRKDKTGTLSEVASMAGASQAAAEHYVERTYTDLPKAYGVTIIRDDGERKSHTRKTTVELDTALAEFSQSATQLTGSDQNKIWQILFLAGQLNQKRSAVSKPLTVEDVAEQLVEVREGKITKVSTEYVRALLGQMRRTDQAGFRDIQKILTDL